MSHPIRYYEDFTVGARFPTRVRTITDADHDAFCQLVGYKVPLFLDDAYARSRGLEGRICPSHLIMSFETAMIGDLFSDTIISLLELTNAQFLQPVRPGDTIRTEVKVIEKRETSKPDRGIVVFRDHVFNQRDEEVFRNDKCALLRRRPA
jgi:acyl dehydratase